MNRVVALMALLLVGAASAFAVTRSDYERLQEWRFTAKPVALPAAGITIREDVAEWRLESGKVWLQEPTTEGAVTGLVFEGKGIFRMKVPDRFELLQLRRFADEPELEALEESFSVLVLRTADPERIGRLGLSGQPPYRPLKPARERHEHWLRLRSHDADAQVVHGLANRGQRYLRVDVKTRSRGWLTFDFDSSRPEEVKLERFHPGYAFLEHWLSLDRAEDRDPQGRPGPIPPAYLDLEHVDLSVELLRLGKDPGVGASGRYTLQADFKAALRFRTREADLGAVRLVLNPFAEVRVVRDGNGRELSFLRDPIGRRSSGLDKRLFDDSLVVLLPAPVALDGRLDLEVEYEMQITNFAPGRYWYPAVTFREVGLGDPHTATLAITTRDELSVRAMGELVEETVEGKLRTTRWRVERPVKMATFTVTRHLQERTLERAGLPRVIAFSPPLGRDTEGRLESLCSDVMDSLEYLQELLDAEIEAPEIYATLIQAFHGQAFEGFLHLSELSAYREGGTGTTELFLAHEVSHQWWGHQVGWASYRDQWLSEGLAQYVAMMYVEARMEKGAKLMAEILQAFGDELKGSIKSSFSRFSWPGSALTNKNAARRMGPPGHGYRAVTGEAPQAYFSQSYRRAALALHALRQVIRIQTGSEDAFVEVLREFVRAHRNGYPTAADFEAVVERTVSGEWGWFFDQWIREPGIPTYRWRSDSAPVAEGGFEIVLRVRQEDVPETFRMLVPVRIEYRGGESEERLVTIDRPDNEIRLQVSRQPEKVVFNPDHAVLARMKG